MLCLDGRLRYKSSAGSHSRDLVFVPSPVQLVRVVDNPRPGGAIRGSMEPSEGKGRESVVAILSFSIW
jgi:hypothetical protein